MPQNKPCHDQQSHGCRDHDRIFPEHAAWEDHVWQDHGIVAPDVIAECGPRCQGIMEQARATS